MYIVTCSSLRIHRKYNHEYVVALENYTYSILQNVQYFKNLKGLSHEIDFKNVVENGQILALIRAAAGFLIFRRLL